MAKDREITRRQLLFTGAAVAGTLLLPEYLGTAQASQDKKPLKVIFVHGWQGVGTLSRQRDGSWVDIVKDFCGDNGIPSVYPDFPGGATPSIEVWKRKLDFEIKEAAREGRDSLLLAYSLGTRAALVFADASLKGEWNYSTDNLARVKGMVLVAPFSNDTANAERRGGAYANFFEHQVDTAAIAEAVPVIRVLHSPNDHQIPYEQGVSMAADLRAPLISPADKAHFNKKEDGGVIIEVLEETLRTYSLS